MRWRRLGRSVKRQIVWRVQDVTQRVRPVRLERWVVRRSDGAIYSGPFRYQGQTFTKSERLHYYYGSESAALRAWEELGGEKYSMLSSKKISIRKVG